MLCLGFFRGRARFVTSFRGSSHMDVLNRRIFVQTLLATAASASPAYAAFHKASFPQGRRAVLPPREAEDDCSPADIEFGNQRIRLSPTGTPLTYQNFVRVGGDWKPS